MLLLLFSCKSQKDVLRSLDSQSRGESLATVTDTSQIHLETSQELNIKGQKKDNSYQKETEFDKDGNISKITETYLNIKFDFDFTNQDELLKTDNFSITGTVKTSSDSDSRIKDKSSSDSRLVQGWEWAIVLLSIALIIIILLTVYFKRKR